METEHTPFRSKYDSKYRDAYLADKESDDTDDTTRQRNSVHEPAGLKADTRMDKHTSLFLVTISVYIHATRVGVSFVTLPTLGR